MSCRHCGLWIVKKPHYLLENGILCKKARGILLLGRLLSKEFVMWDHDPEIFDDMDEHDFEHEPEEDMTDFDLDSEMEVLSDGDAFDEYNSYFDDEY